MDMKNAERTKNMALWSKGLQEMKTALDNAVSACGLSGKCAENVKAASKAVGAM
jgi:hypothetical protein